MRIKSANKKRLKNMKYIKLFESFGNEEEETRDDKGRNIATINKYYRMLSNHLMRELAASPWEIKDKFAEMAEKFEELGNDSQGNPIADGFWKNNKHITEKYKSIMELIENAYSFFRVVAQNAPFRG